MLTALIGADIFDGSQFLHDYALVLSGENIHAVLPRNALDEDVLCIPLAGGILAPGFIDLQVNGGGGDLFNNSPSINTLQDMLRAHNRYGTTAMTPTLISDSAECQRQGLEVVKQAMTDEQGVLGIHLEGPFLKEAYRGTHKTDYLRKALDEDVQWLIQQQRLAGAMKVIVTVAPEQIPPQQIRALADAGIIVCAGHTGASYEQITMALDNGLKGFTHLYNAMPPLKGRDPAVVGAALADPDSWCGVIADGHHVHPAAIKIAVAAKPQGKVFLVSDAMATVGADTNEFMLYGQMIEESGGRLVNDEGRLAGSAIGLIDAVRYCVQEVGITLAQALRMASLYPSQFLGCDNRLGWIKNGYRADLVYLDNQLNVVQTWVAGEQKL